MHSDLENSEILNRTNRESNQISMLEDLKEEEIQKEFKKRLNILKDYQNKKIVIQIEIEARLICHLITHLMTNFLVNFIKTNETMSVPINTAESNILHEKEINETISNINILPLSIKRHI